MHNGDAKKVVSKPRRPDQRYREHGDSARTVAPRTTDAAAVAAPAVAGDSDISSFIIDSIRRTTALVQELQRLKETGGGTAAEKKILKQKVKQLKLEQDELMRRGDRPPSREAAAAPAMPTPVEAAEQSSRPQHVDDLRGYPVREQTATALFHPDGATGTGVGAAVGGGGGGRSSGAPTPSVAASPPAALPPSRTHSKDAPPASRWPSVCFAVVLAEAHLRKEIRHHWERKFLKIWAKHKEERVRVEMRAALAHHRDPNELMTDRPPLPPPAVPAIAVAPEKRNVDAAPLTRPSEHAALPGPTKREAEGRALERHQASERDALLSSEDDDRRDIARQKAASFSPLCEKAQQEAAAVRQRESARREQEAALARTLANERSGREAIARDEEKAREECADACEANKRRVAQIEKSKREWEERRVACRDDEAFRRADVLRAEAVGREELGRRMLADAERVSWDAVQQRLTDAKREEEVRKEAEAEAEAETEEREEQVESSAPPASSSASSSSPSSSSSSSPSTVDLPAQQEASPAQPKGENEMDLETPQNAEDDDRAVLDEVAKTAIRSSVLSFSDTLLNDMLRQASEAACARVSAVLSLEQEEHSERTRLEEEATSERENVAAQRTEECAGIGVQEQVARAKEALLSDEARQRSSIAEEEADTRVSVVQSEASLRESIIVAERKKPSESESVSEPEGNDDAEDRVPPASLTEYSDRLVGEFISAAASAESSSASEGSSESSSSSIAEKSVEEMQEGEPDTDEQQLAETRECVLGACESVVDDMLSTVAVRVAALNRLEYELSAVPSVEEGARTAIEVQESLVRDTLRQQAAEAKAPLLVQQQQQQQKQDDQIRSQSDDDDDDDDTEEHRDVESVEASDAQEHEQETDESHQDANVRSAQEEEQNRLAKEEFISSLDVFTMDFIEECVRAAAESAGQPTPKEKPELSDRDEEEGDVAVDVDEVDEQEEAEESAKSISSSSSTSVVESVHADEEEEQSEAEAEAQKDEEEKSLENEGIEEEEEEAIEEEVVDDMGDVEDVERESVSSTSRAEQQKAAEERREQEEQIRLMKESLLQSLEKTASLLLDDCVAFVADSIVPLCVQQEPGARDDVVKAEGGARAGLVTSFFDGAAAVMCESDEPAARDALEAAEASDVLPLTSDFHAQLTALADAAAKAEAAAASIVEEVEVDEENDTAAEREGEATMDVSAGDSASSSSSSSASASLRYEPHNVLVACDALLFDFIASSAEEVRAMAADSGSDSSDSYATTVTAEPPQATAAKPAAPPPVCATPKPVLPPLKHIPDTAASALVMEQLTSSADGWLKAAAPPADWTMELIQRVLQENLVGALHRANQRAKAGKDGDAIAEAETTEAVVVSYPSPGSARPSATAAAENEEQQSQQPQHKEGNFPHDWYLAVAGFTERLASDCVDALAKNMLWRKEKAMFHSSSYETIDDIQSAVLNSLPCGDMFSQILKTSSASFMCRYFFELAAGQASNSANYVAMTGGGGSPGVGGDLFFNQDIFRANLFTFASKKSITGSGASDEGPSMARKSARANGREIESIDYLSPEARRTGLTQLVLEHALDNITEQLITDTLTWVTQTKLSVAPMPSS